MRKIAFILALMVGATALSQVSLKGITLGEKTTTESPIQTTVAGIEGKLSFHRLKDGRVFYLLFQPSSNKEIGDFFSELYLEQLIEGIESHYDVKLVKDGDDQVYDLVDEKDDINYGISVMRLREDTLYFSFSISSDELSEARKYELKSDF
jgi:hypothetical protein